MKPFWLESGWWVGVGSVVRTGGGGEEDGGVDVISEWQVLANGRHFNTCNFFTQKHNAVVCKLLYKFDIHVSYCNLHSLPPKLEPFAHFTCIKEY